jgi:protease-4
MRRVKRQPRPIFGSAVPRDVRKPKMKWKILPIVWRAAKRGAMVLGFMVILSSLLSGFILSTLLKSDHDPGLADQMVLVLDFQDGVIEMPQELSLSDPFAPVVPTARDIVEAINKAKDDSRVLGIVARYEASSIALSHVQEIRKAIEGFRNTGKFAYIYSSSYGGIGTGLGAYYLASVFDEIWMQPMGVISIAGINAEMPFLRGVLDKVGVTPNFFKRKDYKTAYENITDAQMSEPNREMTTALINDLKDVIVKDIARDRKYEPDQLQRIVDQGLFTAPEAIDSKLIDYKDYADVLLEKIKKDITGDPEDENLAFVSVMDYSGGVDAEKSHKNNNVMSRQDRPKIALIYAVGAIMQSEAGVKMPVGVFDGGVAASDVIAPAILDAAEDEDVKIIVLRVDSPGGSPVASEIILHALEKAKKKGKKIIVSMGATAASGGYWVATNADEIFAMPTTITGSIGVVGGKFAFRDIWPKLGVNWETIKWGENAGMWSINSTFSPSEAERVNAMLDDVYVNFVDRVAKGRKMSPQAVEAIAQGRVWSGKKALEIGLADRQGGLDQALNRAAQMAGAQTRSQVDVVVFPKPKTQIEQFLSIISGEDVMAPRQDLNAAAYMFEMFKPAMREAVMMQNPQDFMVYAPLELN